MPDIAVAGVDRILRKAGAKRVNIKASEKLRSILEELAMEIGEEAVNLSHHAGRQTLRADDVRMAYRHWKNSKNPVIKANSPDSCDETSSKWQWFTKKFRDTTKKRDK
ncbi:MAG: histone family protein [Candidatus Odinarchaeota archaeon]